jgi:hypothetical protein
MVFEGGRLDIAGLAYLSAQKYPLPASGVITNPMPSCGAVPMVVIDTRRIVVPIHDSDAVWLGITAIPDTGLRVRGAMETARHGWLDIVAGSRWDSLDRAQALAVPPATALDGIPRDGGGMWPFAIRSAPACAPASRRLHLYLSGSGAANEERVSLTFVRPAAYRRLTGADPGAAADPAHQFGRYLLA